MQHIAIFASGSGTNAKKIIEYFTHSKEIKIALVVSNKADAGVLAIAKEFGLPNIVIDKNQLLDESFITPLLEKHRIDYIILAGFLLLIPKFLIRTFPKRIINIHPALLPKYGGKGMYGRHVHEAVFKNKERESGITIHFASEHYDEGDIIFQKSVTLSESDSPERIAQKVQQLEHQFFPKVIEELILKSI
jgi:phosphoribosylglycinamide formyltransferase-1